MRRVARRTECLSARAAHPHLGAAFRHGGAVVCTGAGARRNIESEVPDPAGNPIPRLFEAGELGSMFSNLYLNGSYLTEAMISGRAAGRNAVRLAARGEA